MVRHELSRFTKETFPDWSDAARAQYHLLNSTSECLCSECLASAELSCARRRAEADPFTPYERTLTFLQRDVVARLEAALLAAFRFEQSVVEPRRRALWVRYGALTHPLKITIYYVTQPTQQDAILRWLEQFFTDVPQRQRRVLFYRAENWQRESVLFPAVQGWARGPEELLRQHDTDAPSVDTSR